MIKKSLLDLQKNYFSMEKLCFDSMEPICFETPWPYDLVMMNMEAYNRLVQDFDMSPFGIDLDIYDILGYREKILIYCQENDEPIFVSTDKGKDVVFMNIALYNFLAGNPPEYEDDKLEYPPKRKVKRSKETASKTSAKIYSFADFSKSLKAKR